MHWTCAHVDCSRVYACRLAWTVCIHTCTELFSTCRPVYSGCMHTVMASLIVCKLCCIADLSRLLLFVCYAHHCRPALMGIIKLGQHQICADRENERRAICLGCDLTRHVFLGSCTGNGEACRHTQTHTRAHTRRFTMFSSFQTRTALMRSPPHRNVSM